METLIFDTPGAQVAPEGKMKARGPRQSLLTSKYEIVYFGALRGPGGHRGENEAPGPSSVPINF